MPLRSIQSPKPRWLPRKGVTTVESAIMLSLLLWLLMAMLDLGLAVIQSNSLAESAQRICRRATIHGAESPPSAGVWGPGPFHSTAADTSPMLTGSRHSLPTISAEEVVVAITWLDGQNRPRDRVEVELTFLHQPLVPNLMPWGAIKLSAKSTMPIVN